MNITIHASGTPTEVKKSVSDQIAAISAKQTSASSMLSALGSLVSSDLSHAPDTGPGSEAVHVTFSLTVHRPDPESIQKAIKQDKLRKAQAEAAAEA